MALLGSKNQYEKQQIDMNADQPRQPSGQYRGLRQGGRRQAGPDKSPSGRDIPPQLQGYENVAFVDDDGEDSGD